MYNQEIFKKKLMDWMTNFLEVPNKNLHNWAPCPYAQKARLDNKIKLGYAAPQDFFNSVNNEIASFNKNEFEVSIIGSDPNHTSLNDCIDYVNSCRLKFKKNDIWILLDHPLKVEKNNNVIFNNGDYVLIFIQKLSQLNESSGKLRGSGYYEGWDENYLNRLLQR